MDAALNEHGEWYAVGRHVRVPMSALFDTRFDNTHARAQVQAFALSTDGGRTGRQPMDPHLPSQFLIVSQQPLPSLIGLQLPLDRKATEFRWAALSFVQG